MSLTYVEKLQELDRLFGPFSFGHIMFFRNIKEWKKESVSIIEIKTNETKKFFPFFDCILKFVQRLKPT